MPAEDDQMRWLILRHVAERVECAACRHSIAPEEAQVLSHSNDLWFIRVVCERCGTESVVMVTVQARQTPASWPALPDLSASAQSRPITEREIEELHAFLEDFRGNFGEWEADGA